MNIKVGMLLMALVVCSNGCKNQKENQYPNSQMTSVITQHDEMMLKMGTIGKLVSELKPKVDSTSEGQGYQKAMRDLQDANRSMMDWMQGFNEKFDSDEILNGKELNDQKKEWLREEAEKMEVLTLKINSSIENAETLLARQDNK